MSRFPHFARSFPLLKAKVGELPSFVTGANFRTLPKRIGDAYFQTFIYRTEGQRSKFFWTILHGIALCGTCGYLLHQKHSKYERERRRNHLTINE